MDCETSDSKKFFKVFDASKRKRARKKSYDEDNSVATDDTYENGVQDATAKASLQDLSTIQGDIPTDAGTSKRDRNQDSSPSDSQSPMTEVRRSTHSPHRHRKHVREGMSLALKPGNISTPRSLSPHDRKNKDPDCANETAQDSVIYAFLEDAIKKDKRRHRHSHRHEERRGSRDRRRDHHSHDASRDGSPRREHRHRHHRRHSSHDRDTKQSKADPPAPGFDQNVFLQTFAQICAQMTEKNALSKEKSVKELPRTLSHKSLQCEVARNEPHDVDQRPVRLSTREPSWENIVPDRVRSHDNMYESKARLHSTPPPLPADTRRERDKYYPTYDREPTKYSSRADVDRYRDYPPSTAPARSCVGHPARPHPPPDRRDYRDYDDQRRPCESRRYFEQKTSRSFDVPREGLADYDKCCRRTSRSDSHNKRGYEDSRDKRYDDRNKERYYDEKERPHMSNLPSKDRRSKRVDDRLERASVVSRDDDFRERFSERERDSGLSIADGASTISGKSNYLRAVKQEIAEQRDTMDKMMKLWKDMMRYFKNIPETPDNSSQKKNVQDGAASMQETATAQLRLWRECMRRYETVARDVGDTDARLMEEINKQRSEMSEMASMWQECLQRYREMSNDFNNLKKQLTPEPRPVMPPLVCAEGEGPGPAPPYRMPPGFPPMMNQQSMYETGSPLRSRASAPPIPATAWWWTQNARETRSPRRRSSPDSRGSRDREETERRERKHRHKERDEPRYKEKSKPSAARSEHRHRKR